MVMLDHWADSEVSVRAVSDGDDLIAVFRGRLGQRSGDKPPAPFWPLLVSDQHLEQAGIYLHPERFENASTHTESSCWSCVRERSTSIFAGSDSGRRRSDDQLAAGRRAMAAHPSDTAHRRHLGSGSTGLTSLAMSMDCWQPLRTIRTRRGGDFG